MKKTILLTKKIINYSYNQFSIENYQTILNKHFEIIFSETDSKSPIKLMSGQHELAGIIRTAPKLTKKRNIYIIGKGILFDSGGLDLKRGMNDMTNDKAGAIIALSVANYFKTNVVAYCPISTNFVQNSLITPGDKIKIGKKIVKITSTDAEGRLILAETLTQLNASQNDIIITIATLTGCAPYAVDTKATAFLTPNDKLAEQYSNASKDAKEYAWRLPLWDYADKFYHKKEIVNADKRIKADTIGAALFLKQFVKYPNNWIHMDIATSSFDKDGKANGVPIKSLIKFIGKIK